MLINKRTLQYYAELYKVLGGVRRLEILHALSKGEKSVESIAKKVGVKPNVVSHNLTILRLHRLVKSRNEGRKTYYSINVERFKKCCRVMSEVLGLGQDKTTK